MPETLLFYVLVGAGDRGVGARHRPAQPDVQRDDADRVVRGRWPGLYIQLDAPFVAMAQIIIYAGAIMVLFLFVVMLLNAPQEDAAEWDRTHPLRRPGVARFGALLAGAAGRAAGVGAAARPASSTAPVGGRADGADGQLGARAGARALHRPRVRVRSHVDPDPGGDGRRRGAGAAGGRVVIPLSHYLIVSALLFAIGTRRRVPAART